ncbi:kinetochore-associated protein 1 [Scleropages formosus]|uniref:kinetochore-associated protein 1 n=1 Tax=Scleropages formosus TaxID=113540 RepID=UPI0010FAC07B|nr:kinetochore-associated protein 1 [Scleropages formosus]
MWNDVELLANDDTSTVRVSFDLRRECGSALYQVDNLVKLSCSEKVLHNPDLYASYASNYIVVVADRTVVLFDYNFQSVLLHLNFGSDVDTVAVCHRGQFLLVGERNGNLHLVYVPQKSTVFTKAILQKSLSEKEKTYRSLVIEEDRVTSGSYHLFLLVADGFFHISNLELENIERAIVKMDIGELKKLQSVIKTEVCSTKDIYSKGCNVAVTTDLAGEICLITGGSGENVLSQWRMHPAKNTMSISHLLDSSLMLGVKKIQVLDNLMYTLDEENVLSVWEVNMLVMVWCWPELAFHDFLITTEGRSSSVSMQEGSSMKLVALTVPNSSQMRSLVVYSLPSMTALYSLEVSSTSALVKMGVNMDTVYLLEGISKSLKSPEDPVSSVVVRCFTEALPENRLSRLLHKHKFEEAETFAIQFGLDVELVYKVKLDFVLEKLASSPSGGYGQEVFSELVEEAKTNLAKINDEHFVVQYSVKAPWPTFSTAQEMLNHANSRYPCSQIQEALSKLATFCGLNGPEKFNGISWIEFLQSSDYIIDILWHLRDGDLRGAQYLWLRNEPEFAEQFDEKTLDALLSSIPKDVPSKDLCPWFRTIVIPFIRKTFPKGQKKLSRWLEQRARNLELTEKADWPQNGLEMAQLGLPSFWLWLPLEDDCGLEEVEQLRSLVQSLRQLLDLFNKYHCKLSLSDFEKRNTRSIVFLMLDKVLAPELIPSVIESSVRPYTQEHRLHLDELLLHYIRDMLERCSSQTTSLFTEWEAKAMAVLDCMTDSDLVEDAVLEIMYKAVVPWSSVVEQLVQKHLEMDHPRQELLKESYQLMEIKKLLRVYGIRNFNPSSDNLAMVLVRRILKQDLPSSLEDALKVAQVYKLDTSQIYFLYIIQLISQAKRELCVTVLKELPPAEAECVTERLATWARLELQNKHLISEEHKKHHIDVAQVMVESLKFLQRIQQDNAFKRIECVNNLKMFEAIANLQEDFDIFLSPEEYADRALRAQFQEQHITAYENTKARGRLQDTRPIVANDPDGKTKTISTEAGLYRLARQLQRSEQELWADLALRALLVGKVDKALKICSELYQHHYDACTGRVLFHAAKMLCQMLEDNVPMIIPDGINLPAIIHNLACQAITVCHPDLLLDCVELCKSTRAAMDVYQQCQIDDDGFTAKESSSVMDCGPYTEWSFQNIFNEDGIVLDPVSVLPFQYKITNCLLPSFSDSKRYPLDCSCLSNCSYKDELDFLQPLLSPVTVMLQNLQECSQLELALRLLVNTFGSSLQHIASNNIDLTLSSQLHNSQRLLRDRKCLSDFGNFTLNSIKTVAMALLHKVLNWRVVDCSLAIGYCTLLPQSDMLEILWKVINNTWQNYHKILAVAMVGAQLCSLYKEETQREKFLSLVTDAEWGIKLAKLGISIQPVFRQCPEMKNNLIPTLVKNRNMTAELILEYCSTFDLDCNLALSMYITTLLLEGEGESQDLVGDKGEAQTSKLSKVDAVEQALQIIPLLQSTSELAVSLNAAILKLSPYNYERIEGLLRIIENAGETIPSFPLDQAIRLLQYLKSYKRISAPGELENSYLLEQALEPTQLAQTRLPFHLLFKTGRCFWKIITPELSEQTFPTLLLISKLMKVSLDKLYMSAVNHMFERSLKPLLLEQMRQGSCSTTSKKTARIAHTIMDYVLCIKNPEWAAATAHRIAQELPPGIEKTKSLKFCLALGEKWLKVPDLEEETRSKGEIFMEKLKVQYQCSATENILASRNLLSPELLKLTGLPVRLLAALWEHSSVEQRMGNPAGYAYPDIHAVAKEIAAINNVDLSKVRDMMLEKWLCKTGPSVKEINSQDYVTDIHDDPDLMRVVYLLQMYPMDFSSRLLSSILTAETWPLSNSRFRLTFCHRARALLCVVHIADPSTLETLLHIPRDKVQYYLKCYIHLAQLEGLNIPYTVDSFLNSPKEGLIKGLWKNHSHEPEAVRLVSDLCLEYQVFDPQLWNGVLQKLLTFNMISYLQKVLEALGAVPSLLQLSNFSRTWRSVIMAPFMTASLPLSPEQIPTFYKTFVLLLKCPFLLNMDLIGIAKCFTQVNLPCFSLGSLLLISCTSKKERNIQCFLSTCDLVTVLEQVEDHMNTGELAGIPSEIKETVLTFVYQNGHHEKLLKTKLFPHFCLYMASKGHYNQVKDMVEYLISRKCEEDAASLAREYLRCQEREGGKHVPASWTASDILKVPAKY